MPQINAMTDAKLRTEYDRATHRVLFLREHLDERQPGISVAFDWAYVVFSELREEVIRRYGSIRAFKALERRAS